MRNLPASRNRSPRLDRGDRLVMWLLTLLYTVFTLINLGTLNFPQTVWKPVTGERVVVDLGGTRDVSAVWFNGNIAVGRLHLAADDGNSLEYEQVYGEMFSWRKKTVNFHTRYVALTVLSGDIALNEIAFLDENNERIAASVPEPAGTQSALLDEPGTVPEASTYFNGMYFDEIYHARTGYEFIHRMNPYEWTHPPLGKTFISLGIRIFGMTPFGWRVIPALFGAGMLPVVFLLGKRFFCRRDYAFLAQALMALDTMHYAQSRIATVDVFIVFFILWMFFFMTDYLRADVLHDPWKKILLPLGACGISFGLGVASKWTGLYAGVGLAVLFFAGLIAAGVRAGRAGETGLFWSRVWKILLFCVGFFIVIPALTYFISYLPFYQYEIVRRPDVRYGLRDAFRTIVQQQRSMFGYHSGLTATHLCQSNWYEWPFAERSVWFYFGSAGNLVSNISSFGSPAVWWVSAAGALCLITEAVFGRMRSDPDYRKKAALVLLAAAAANLLPWMLVTRCTFQYHFFPTLPFMIFSAVLLLQHLEERGEVPSWAKWCWLGLAAAYFLLLLPAASGLPMPKMYARFIEYVLPTGVIFHGAV